MVVQPAEHNVWFHAQFFGDQFNFNRNEDFSLCRPDAERLTGKGVVIALVDGIENLQVSRQWFARHNWASQPRRRKD
jgi:hypothetical protein